LQVSSTSPYPTKIAPSLKVNGQHNLLISPLLPQSDPGYPQLCEAICLLSRRLVHPKKGSHPNSLILFTDRTNATTLSIGVVATSIIYTGDAIGVVGAEALGIASIISIII
jgi:hypothetical protein